MKKILISTLVVIVLIIGGYFILGSNKAPTTTTEINNEIQNPNQTTPATDEGTVHEVIISASGYTPKELIIKVGDTITFKNGSSSSAWTASAMHPSHTVYSGSSLQQHCPDTENTTFDQCGSSQPGESWSFIFTKAGSWGYHDHLNATHFGKITVTE